MLKSFIVSIVSISFLCIVSDMIIPEGTMKKYLKLVFGFMIMSALLAPVTKFKQTEPFRFSFDSEISNEEITAKSDAYILKIHEDNIRKHIETYFAGDTEIFIELFSDGRVKSVKIYCEKPDILIEEKLKSTLGCENIELVKRGVDDG
ncbi:MAG: stage III sporulation protein AF [Clostridia bacterium]|nr:stage III sporulation protein AF [Clostridia bacterium]